MRGGPGRWVATMNKRQQQYARNAIHVPLTTPLKKAIFCPDNPAGTLFPYFLSALSGCLSQVKSVIATPCHKVNRPFVAEKNPLLFWRPRNSEGNSMRVGILFPVVIFINTGKYGNIILAWFYWRLRGT